MTYTSYTHRTICKMAVEESRVERMKRMSKRQEQIRNIATSAHIHHGKTAFTDNLLAAAGFMSEAAAGELEKGMATWQHSDEQERLLTVDSANVSMVHEFHGEEFLINLIDTPGHIDFGGNVTRAMRAVDGTVVLVCASEGIMPQTETVLKQALRERVKPVLFINKVDRLIKEMQYTPEQMQKRFVEIITEFNKLVEQIAETDFKQKWKVNIQDGSVAFGSARDNWALSLPFMQKKNVNFKDVLRIYELEKEEREKFVWEKCPLHEVILDMVIKHLPNPKESQAYRIPKIWRGDLESPLGKSLLTCDPNGKLAFCITRILIEPKSGREVSAGRLYSGTVHDGLPVYLNNAKQFQKVSTVFMYQGIKTEIMESVPAGNILAIAGISGTAGETITLEPDQPFEELKHIFEPVITKAIQPDKPQDLSKLVEVLKKVAKEDPSIKMEINLETGENLMHGMGELHLEIVENRIVTEKGVKIKTSPPIVTYRETIAKKSPECEGKTPNKHNKLFFVVEPLEPQIRELIISGEVSEGRIKKKDLVLRDKLVAAGWDNDTALSVKDIYHGCVFMEKTRGIVQLPECIELIIEGFEQVMDGGPLAREPCVGIKVTLVDAKLHEDAIHRGPAQIYPAVREGIKLCMMNANPVMFEPMQTHLIEAPIEFTGDITKLVMNKRGQVLELTQEGTLSFVKAKLPVAEMLGWSSDLRSATGGRGNSSLMDQCFERLPVELQNRVIQQIVQRKGLTAGMLGA
ncbi:Elongation factor 2 [uncultured archaeon]|nr:Elongation factor 2 [uncultured archaeon]